MFFKIKYHLNKVLLLSFFILLNCQIQDPNKNHGILFLENRSEKLIIDKSNANDVIKIIGEAHSKSINEENIWIYIERTLTKGKYHKLGQHVLKTNNVLVLEFDKYGVLKSKEFYNKEDIKKLKFSKDITENNMSKKSFVQTFLQSIKQKMYGNRK